MENSKTVLIDIQFCNGEWIFESMEDNTESEDSNTIYLDHFEIFDDPNSYEKIILTINAEECENREDLKGFCDIQKVGPKVTGLLLVFNSDWFQTDFLGIFELLAEASNNLEWVTIDCDFYPHKWYNYFVANQKRFPRLKNFNIDICPDIIDEYYLTNWLNRVIENGVIEKTTFSCNGEAITRPIAVNDEVRFVKYYLMMFFENISYEKIYGHDGNAVSQEMIENLFIDANFNRRKDFLLCLAGSNFLKANENEVQSRLFQTPVIQVLECNDLLRIISGFI